VVPDDTLVFAADIVFHQQYRCDLWIHLTNFFTAVLWRRSLASLYEPREWIWLRIKPSDTQRYHILWGIVYGNLFLKVEQKILIAKMGHSRGYNPLTSKMKRKFLYIFAPCSLLLKPNEIC
jgi:hypothetical protein